MLASMAVCYSTDYSVCEHVADAICEGLCIRSELIGLLTIPESDDAYYSA